MRPRKNHSQKQNQNEHRYTDKIFEFWQQINVSEDQILDELTARSESWLKEQAERISYEDGQTELITTLALGQPDKGLDKFAAQKALYALIKGMQPIAELAMLVGYLLIVKSTLEEEEKTQVQFKIYNLTSAQHKIMINNPTLLQMPFRLEISLGLNEEQMVVFEEGEVLES
ncbi:hypothetical protein BKI52_11255 [marine bacterium AO1-C]|nr:hypothetical protein BKI52_11255 [marine bacterium AO1-C]